MVLATESMANRDMSFCTGMRSTANGIMIAMIRSLSVKDLLRWSSLVCSYRSKHPLPLTLVSYSEWCCCLLSFVLGLDNWMRRRLV